MLKPKLQLMINNLSASRRAEAVDSLIAATSMENSDSHGWNVRRAGCLTSRASHPARQSMTRQFTTVTCDLIPALAAIAIAGPFANSALAADAPAAPDAGLHYPQERHLANVRQLTFGGQNAEAYFSFDGERLIFQSTRPPYRCDQIFAMNVDGSHLQQLSSGKGRTTCSYFFPDGKHIIYASTQLTGGACPPEPDRSKGYVWPIYPSYEIFSANADGSALKRLTDHWGYDAEGVIAPDGKKIVFTSKRDGDLDIYTMNADGSGVQRLTDAKGYDGGPFYAWDGEHIVYRAYHPKTPDELKAYEDLLAQDLIKPSRAEIFIMRADGSDKRQVTSNGAANWAPFLHPNNRQIIFSSNLHDPERRSFSLYVVNTDGTGLERVTYGARFDAFPMFSRDGRRLVFASTRNAKEKREFNIFIADWVP
jgi:TolB protein